MPSNDTPRIDAWEVCEWMEKMPDKGPYDFRPWRSVSPEGWWNAEPQFELNEWLPRDLTLNALHLVEEKLTDAQCVQYEREVYAVMQATKPRPKRWYLWHADAPTRLAALAAVIRSTR